MEIVLILTQDRCTVCAERTIVSDIVLDAPMELLGDVCNVECHLFPVGDCVSVGARLVYGLRQTYHRLRNLFGRTRGYSKVSRLKWKLVSVQLEIVLDLTQDRCTVCAKCTKGSEIILDAPDGTPK